jgi:excisionase family DNA binding protein
MLQTLSNEKLAFSVNESAEILSIGARTVWRMVEEGTIRAIRLGRRVVIPKSELERLLKQ